MPLTRTGTRGAQQSAVAAFPAVFHDDRPLLVLQTVSTTNGSRLGTCKRGSGLSAHTLEEQVPEGQWRWRKCTVQVSTLAYSLEFECGQYNVDTVCGKRPGTLGRTVTPALEKREGQGIIGSTWDISPPLTLYRTSSTEEC